MSLPWTGKDLKLAGEDNDEVLILDTSDTNPDTINKRLKLSAIPAVSGGVSDGRNLGSGAQVFFQKDGTFLEFRTLEGQTNKIVLVQAADDITFTLGSDVVTIDKANTYGDFAQTFPFDKLFIKSTTSPFTYQIIASAISANRTLTLPPVSANDIFVTEGFSQTLINKTLTNPIISIIENNGTITLPDGPQTLVGRNTIDIFTGAKTFGTTGDVGKLIIAGTTSGTTVLNASGIASGILTLPATTDTLVGINTTDILQNKTLLLPVIAQIVNTPGTLTLPTTTDTLMGKNTTDIFTNKTFVANVNGNILNNVQVTDLAVGTAGELITWDSSNDATTVAVGTNGDVLTSQGIGMEPVFSPASGGTLKTVKEDEDIKSTNREAINFIETTNQIKFVVTDSPTPLPKGQAIVAASISLGYLGQESIVTLGTIASGTWGSSATPIAVPSGGTGVTTLTDKGILFGNAANPVGITAVGTAEQILTSNGPAVSPTFKTLSGTANRIAILNSPTDHTFNIDLGYIGQASITTLGTIGGGTWGPFATTIAVPSGGTGATTVNQGGVLFGSSPTLIDSTAAGTEGQILLSHGTNAPTFETQSGLTNVVIRSAADFPDAVQATLNNVGDGSPIANFNFTFNPLSPTNPYVVGQTVKIASGVSSYDGDRLIKTIGVGTFTATDLADTDINFNGDTSGTIVRTLAKDSGYELTLSITTTVGYELPDNSRLSLRVINGPQNRITVSNAATFLKGRLVRGLAFENIIVQAPIQPPPFPETYFDIEGTNDPTVSIITWRDTSVNGFGSLGTVDGASFACADSIFPAYENGFTITNSIVNVSNVGYLPFLTSTSSFLTINNVQQGLISPISGILLPFTVTMTNLTALNKSGQFGVNINAATPLTNTFSITNSTKPIGGTMFAPSATASTGSISKFESADTDPITSIQVGTIGGAAFSQINTDNTDNLSNNDTVFISGTKLYDGPAVITSLSADTSFEINKTFTVDASGPSPQWDKVGSTPTTVITTAVHGLVDTNSVKIENSVNYNQTFDITAVPTTTSFTLTRSFISPDSSIAKFTQIRNIEGFAASSTATATISSVISNGRGGTRITTTSLSSDFLNGRKVIISGTTDGGADATATATLTSGVVTSITVTAGGTSYDTPPIVRIDIVGGTRATAVATVVSGVVTEITVTDGGSGYTGVPTVTLISTDGVYDGEFKIFNVAGTNFDILLATGVASVGTVDLDLTTVTSANHKFATNNSVLIDKTVQFDDGYIVDKTTDDVFTIDKLFILESSPITGTVSDESLTGTAKNILVNTVSGELSSKAKGSFAMNGNATTTTLVEAVFANLVLFGITMPATTASDVVESSDTELFRLINNLTGELEYTGLEPFSGQFTVTLSLNGTNGSNYTLRAVKNDEAMIDGTEQTYPFTNAQTNVTFIVSVTAITGDRFRMQVRNDSAAANIIVTAISAVIQ